MHIQIVMDCSGDTRHSFDPADTAAVEDARLRFRTMTAGGFRAVALAKDGQPGTLLREFDATVEETLFIPQLRGG